MSSSSPTEGEGARMERNPSYYRRDDAGAQLPFIDGIDARIITDRSAARAALVSGQIDSYYPDSKAEADDLLNSDLYLETMPGSTFISAVMHPEKAPFTDARARRALALALNRDQYVDNRVSRGCSPERPRALDAGVLRLYGRGTRDSGSRSTSPRRARSSMPSAASACRSCTRPA